MIEPEDLSEKDLKVLHAALIGMTKNVHACQDLLSSKDWDRTDELQEQFDDELNERLS